MARASSSCPMRAGSRPRATPPRRCAASSPNELEEQTPDPQVQVRRLAGDGATVSLVGAVGGQGVYPIERPTRTLAAMLAQAGGVTIDPEIAQVTVIRGNHTGKIWFQDLFSNPRFDIALRGGDRILVEEDTRVLHRAGCHRRAGARAVRKPDPVRRRGAWPRSVAC